MSQKKYWQSFGEVNDSENFRKQHQDEFKEELPFEGFDDKGLVDAKAPRRDFLKYLGFSTAAATLAASCKMPVKKAIPFADKPSDVIPGVAKYYATTYVQDGDVIPVVAKVRDGRPIKIEGNDLAYTKGGTTARAQASVLDLYDTSRIRFPHRVANGKLEETTYEFIDKTIGDALKTAGNVVFLSSTITSPTTKEIIAKFPNLRHIQVDADSFSGMLLANEASGFGRKIPSYNFATAKVIVSLGADFLGTWLSPVEFAKGYSAGRRIDEKNPSMSKHYQFEGHLSTTGANADERFTHRPSETGAVALDILNALTGGEVTTKSIEKGIRKVADDLNKHNGQALVVCGSNDKNVQLIVNAINSAIGAYGTTIDWSTPVNYRQGIDKDLTDLVAQMEGGQVGALLIYGANPVLNYSEGKYDENENWRSRFADALKKVRVTVSFNERMDETTKLCQYIVPTHHYLESWGDAEPKAGHTSFMQPTIYPLFKTRPYQTSLLRWSQPATTEVTTAAVTDYDVYFKNYWIGKLGSENDFNAALQKGFIEPTSAVAVTGGGYGAGSLDTAKSAIASARKIAGDEIVLYQKVSIGTGTGATNPWLQELPDAISKATWDNYALMSMTKAKELLDLNLIDGSEREGNNYEYYPQKPVITITVAGKGTISLPVLIIPGMNTNTIAVAVGYGRSEDMGKTAAGVGKNAYGLASFNQETNVWNNAVTLADANRKYKIAQTQIHNSYENRIEVVRETTLGSFKKDPNVIPAYKQHLVENFAKSTGDFRAEATLYPQHEQPGIKWGMSIDMNACYGCGACVVACHAENNVPVVGKREVMRYHDMHWLRIDRYFVSGENPDDLKGVVFQPMLCQHCDNAPCENVCPVSATNHSAEGINQMAYNRCIGTRYCANNCPFKVRRFNWADYTGADSFSDNQDQQLVGKLDDVVFQMNDDLTRMVLNPDVTVRSRGVMEKCTFCIQKLQAAKLEAKKDNRMLVDGDAKTACQMACSADAIVFGNAHDKNSQISKVRAENPQRTFHVLEQLHVLPNVTYLAKVRNSEDEAANWKSAHAKSSHSDHKGAEKKTEAAPH
jgi:MoCo/4Fe-4S cofactor protein with predicted Tat translocation signal